MDLNTKQQITRDIMSFSIQYSCFDSGEVLQYFLLMLLPTSTPWQEGNIVHFCYITHLIKSYNY